MRVTEVLACENASALRQGLAVLDRIDDVTYAGPEPGRTADGVGPQFRHLIEFYRCMLDGAAARRIDYTSRKRDRRLESDRGTAIAAVRTLIDELLALSGAAELLVRVELPQADGRKALWSRSTLPRELQFLQSHTIHHYALIRRELTSRGIELAPEFGVAPSTLDHWREVTPLAD